MKKIIFLLIVAGFVHSCKTAQSNEATAPSVTEAQLHVSESAKIENTTITFKDVIEDSRCPKDVNCIWAGRAKLLVEVSSEGNTETKEVIFGATKNGEKTNHVLFPNGNTSIEAISISPEKLESGNIEKEMYVLYVKKASE